MHGVVKPKFQLTTPRVIEIEMKQEKGIKKKKERKRKL